jgi:hypothetical protein
LLACFFWVVFALRFGLSSAASPWVDQEVLRRRVRLQIRYDYFPYWLWDVVSASRKAKDDPDDGVEAEGLVLRW